MSGVGGVVGLVGVDEAALQWRVLLWPVLFGAGAYLFVTAPTQAIGRPKPNLRERLRRLDVDERIRDRQERRGGAPPMFSSPLLERMLRPVVDDVGRLLAGWLERLGLAGGEDVARKLAIARPGVDPGQFLGEKVVGGAFGLAILPLMNLLGVYLHTAGPWPGWAWVAAGVLGFAAPDWQLERRLSARRTAAIMELPTLLDLLAIAAAAGLALEQALERVAEQSRGVVSEELQQAVRDMTLGSTLSQALDAMAQRNAVPELTSVVTQLRAAHEQGLPLAQALAVQAESLRERKRLKILEIGGKATVKMLVPVALLILPVLFVVLLVPAGVEMMNLAG